MTRDFLAAALADVERTLRFADQAIAALGYAQESQFVSAALSGLGQPAIGKAVHSMRVAAVAADIRYEETRSTEAAQEAGLAAALHDIGWTGLPTKLHAKQLHELTSQDWQHIRMHPLLGYDMISGAYGPLVSIPSLTHHTHQLGAYPDLAIIHRALDRTAGAARADASHLGSLIAAADQADGLFFSRQYRRVQPSPQKAARQFEKQCTGDAYHRRAALRRYQQLPYAGLKLAG